MRKPFLYLAVFFFAAVCSTINAQGVFLDTLVSRYVGPGAVYTKLKAPTMPWDIDVLRIDLKNPYIKVETIKAKDLYSARETTSSMAKRKTYEGHYVIGAVNGDFYDLSTGKPINIQVENGEVIRLPISLSALGFGPDNKPMLSIVGYTGSLIAKGASNKIYNVNETRNTDQLILYNSYMGASTKTNAYGVEALVRPLKPWMVNDTISCVVEKVESSVGNMSIGQGKAVLSGHGASGAFITSNLHAGDTVKIYQQVSPGISKIKEMIGGYPKIVNKGLNYAEQGFIEEGGPDHAHNREPRTAAGFSADSSALYLVTLDGRASSIGATLAELADVMIKVGVAYGVNFDGGGSTTMLVRGTIMNRPSDGSEREDANCLSVVSSAPSKTDSLKSISISAHRKKVFKGDKIQFSIWGNDSYGNPVALDSTLIKYNAMPSIGSIDKNGLFTAVNKAASGYVYASYGSYIDSSFVLVKPIDRLSISPRSITVDAKKPSTLVLRAYDLDNVERSIIPGEVYWKSSNPAIAVVDSNGIVSGKSEGSVKIIAALTSGSVADTINVSVQIGKGDVLVNGFESITGWKVTGQNIDTSYSKISLSANKSEGTSSLKIDYKFTYDPAAANYLYVNTNIPVYGIPDSLFIDTRSDSTAHKLSLVLSDDNDEQFRVNAYGYVNTVDKFNTIPIPMKNFAVIGTGSFYYPVRITKFEIQLQFNNSKRVAGQTYTGTIYFDNLKARYPVASAVSEEQKTMPEGYFLAQNYPNPFNPSTVIEFSVMNNNDDVSLKVYDLLGREVAVLVNGKLSGGMHKAVWNAGNNASGVYFYRLQSGSFVETKKMMLVR